LGGRTIKTGQSRWFVGYKKHTLRLWLATHEPAVLLVPLVSWVAPASRGEVLFLRPSLQRCARRFGWAPQWTVGDMAYISTTIQRQLREELHVAVITKLRPDMNWLEPYNGEGQVRCPQGERLSWLGFEAAAQQQWFGAATPGEFCPHCWESSHCPREFNYPAARHEILFGLVPHASWLAKHLLAKVRPWIEPAQSYEKNQLGLSALFLNSLSFAWTMGLLADTAVLLRATALRRLPATPPLLAELAPRQLDFDWD
jgi:hypothetical protein